MDNSDYNGYYVALVIVTIVTIAISIALSFYFIFLPASRIETEFENLQVQGISTISELTRLINSTEALGDEILEQTCVSYIYAVDKLFGKPADIPTLDTRGCIIDFFCVNNNPLIPTICNPFITNIPLCCQTNPDTC